MYLVMIEGDPLESTTDCIISLLAVFDRQPRVLVKSMSTDFARQGEAYEFLQSVVEILNNPPSNHFRKQLILSIGDVSEMVRKRKIWEKTYEGHLWLKRFEAMKSIRAKRAKKK